MKDNKPFSIKKLEKETANRIKDKVDKMTNSTPKKRKKKVTASRRTFNKIMGRNATDSGDKK